MKLTHKLKLYIITIHVLMIGCIWMAEAPIWSIIVFEIVLTLSIILGLWWVNQIGQHFELITSSVDNIKSGDFAIQFKKTGHKEFDVLISVYNTMIHQLKSERVSTNEIDHLLANIIEKSPSGIVLFDFDDRIKAVNPAAETLLDQNKQMLIGKGKKDISPDLSELLFNTCAEWQVIQQEANNIFRVYGGKFINRGFETRFVLFENFSKEIYEMEKQSYEKLIRIMGHEINNTMGAVNSVLDTYIGKHNDNYSNAFQIVKERNDNLIHFTNKLSEVAKLPQPEPIKVDLMPIIKQCVVLMKSKFSEHDIAWKIPQEIFEFIVEVDIVQIEQVLINILTNAAEAIERSGFIEFKISPASKEIFIQNNGAALSEEQKKNIFSPFYTTKNTGQGIGLTLTREILNNHHFNYRLKTVDSGITEFYIGFNALDR